MTTTMKGNRRSWTTCRNRRRRRRRNDVECKQEFARRWVNHHMLMRDRSDLQVRRLIFLCRMFCLLSLVGWRNKKLERNKIVQCFFFSFPPENPGQRCLEILWPIVCKSLFKWHIGPSVILRRKLCFIWACYAIFVYLSVLHQYLRIRRRNRFESLTRNALHLMHLMLKLIHIPARDLSVRAKVAKWRQEKLHASSVGFWITTQSSSSPSWSVSFSPSSISRRLSLCCFTMIETF